MLLIYQVDDWISTQWKSNYNIEPFMIAKKTEENPDEKFKICI